MKCTQSNWLFLVGAPIKLRVQTDKSHGRNSLQLKSSIKPRKEAQIGLNSTVGGYFSNLGLTDIFIHDHVCGLHGKKLFRMLSG